MKKNIPDNTKQVTFGTEIVKQQITVNTCENDAYKFTENFRDARRAFGRTDNLQYMRLCATLFHRRLEREL